MLWSLLNDILGLLFLVLGVALAVIAVSQFSVRKIVMPPRIFMLEERPALVIHNPTGSVHIHSGVSNSVEVMATKYVNGWFGSQEEGAIDYAQDGNIIRVTTRSNYRWSPLGGLRNVNLDITVPEQERPHITTTSLAHASSRGLFDTQHNHSCSRQSVAGLQLVSGYDR